MEDTDSEVPAAVDRAAMRLARAVTRALERRREATKAGVFGHVCECCARNRL